MRIRRVPMVLAMAVMSVALVAQASSQSQDQNKDAAQANKNAAQANDKAPSQDKKPAVKKDANTSGDPAQGNHIKNPMLPVPKQAKAKDASDAGPANVDSDSTKDIKMPFGIGKSAGGTEQKTGVGPNVSNWKVKDLGDSVRFEFPTAMGAHVWIKKKSELSEPEKQAWANATPAPAAADSPANASGAPQK
jgi:hypothetical protein